MQDRYAGDIGDYVKLALLRALSVDRRLGVAWYLYPNEAHNADGRHVSYLRQPDKWRHFDPELFDNLAALCAGARSVEALEASRVIDAAFFRELLDHGTHPAAARSFARAQWFDRLLSRLSECDIVFADPDNGLTDDQCKRRSRPRFGKHLPLEEALALAANRCAVIYHHNSRFRGGHDAEVEHWGLQLGDRTIAVRATAFACRTFFIVNPTEEIRARAESFCHRWSEAKVRFHRPPACARKVKRVDSSAG